MTHDSANGAALVLRLSLGIQTRTMTNHEVDELQLTCPITGRPCKGDLSYLCEDYGCARKGGLSPKSEENSVGN
jgi:hypothetical protein